MVSFSWVGVRKYVNRALLHARAEPLRSNFKLQLGAVTNELVPDIDIGTAEDGQRKYNRYEYAILRKVATEVEITKKRNQIGTC